MMKKLLILYFIILPNFLWAADEIRIALLTELTGTNMINGEGCREGFDIARESFAPKESTDGRKISFLYADSQGLPKAGVSEFKKLTEIDKIHAAVVTRSQIGMAINALSRQKKVPIMGIVGHADFIKQNPYAYRFWPTVKQEGPYLAQKLKEMKKQKVAIVTLEDEWTLSLTEHFKNTVKKNGGSIVYEESINESDVDLLSIVTKIRKSAPDAIFINLALAHSGALIRKIREQGMKQQIYSNFWGANQDTIKSAGEKNIEGIIYTAINLDQPEFLNKLENKYGHRNATSVTYNCYVGLANILTAIKNDQDATDRKALHASLQKINEIPLLDKSMRMKAQEADFDLQYKTVRNGKNESL